MPQEEQEARTFCDVCNDPGVTIPEMTEEEATAYIMRLGNAIVSLPQTMAFMGHETVKGTIYYLTNNAEKLDQAKQDLILFWNASSGRGKTVERAATPGLPEAIARMYMASERARLPLPHKEEGKEPAEKP